MPFQLPFPKDALQEIVIPHAVPQDERLWVPQADPAAPVVLFLHGVRWDVRASTPRMRQLHALGFSVLGIDYRGFGRSTNYMPSETLVAEDARAAWDWLVEMMFRLRDGKSPVTEAEFYALAEWFHAHEAELLRLESPSSQMLELGNGRRTCTTNIRLALAKGSRALRVTQVVEELRLLRELYAEWLLSSE